MDNLFLCYFITLFCYLLISEPCCLHKTFFNIDAIVRYNCYLINFLTHLTYIHTHTPQLHNTHFTATESFSKYYLVSSMPHAYLSHCYAYVLMFALVLNQFISLIKNTSYMARVVYLLGSYYCHAHDLFFIMLSLIARLHCIFNIYVHYYTYNRRITINIVMATLDGLRFLLLFFLHTISSHCGFKNITKCYLNLDSLLHIMYFILNVFTDIGLFIFL